MTPMRRVCRLVGHALLLGAAQSAISADREVSITLVASTASGLPVAGTCVFVLQPNAAYGGQTDETGRVTVVVPVPEGQSIINGCYTNRGLPLIWPAGQAVPLCGAALSPPGEVLRMDYFGTLQPNATSATLEIKSVETIVATLSVVDAADQPVDVDGAVVVGLRALGVRSQDDRIRFGLAPKNEPIRVAVSVQGEVFIASFGPQAGNADLGSVRVSPAPRTAPVVVTYSMTSDDFAKAILGRVTLISTDGARIYQFNMVEKQGMLGGPKDGDANLVAPGDYYAVPGSIINDQVVRLIDRLRSGNAAGLADVPRVAAIKHEVRPVHVVANTVDRVVRRAVEQLGVESE